MFLRRNPASVLVGAGVTSTEEKIPLISIYIRIKVNQHVFMPLLERIVRWIDATLGESGITLQHNGATSHTANRVQEWCEKKLWPTLSPVLNANDFCDLTYSEE